MAIPPRYHRALRTVLLLAPPLLTWAGGCSEGPPGADALRLREAPERIVLIVVDTLRRDVLSTYGGRLDTPHLDALAERGQRFEAAVASFHQTTMSMGSLFTGRTPSLESGDPARSLAWTGRNWCGLRRFADAAGMGTCVPEGVPTLAERLRDAGYATIGVTSNALLFAPAGFERGFDRWIEVGPGADDPIDAEAVKRRAAGPVNAAALQALRDRPSDRFFLYVHYMDAHDYQEVAAPEGGKPGGLLEHPYAQGILRVDRAVGELLGELDRLDLTRDSVVILTSDHGERLGEEHLVTGTHSHYGNPSFEEVLRIPLIVSPAAYEEAAGLVRSEDLHHMVLRLAGGESAREPELSGGEVFTSESGFQTYREGSFKSYLDRRSGSLRLVDLSRDPGETVDVAVLYPEVAAEHRARLDALTRALAAPDAAPSSLTEDDRKRLRAVGYLE